MSTWALMGLLLGIGGAALLTGAGLGYYTAARDLGRERARAWDEGATAARSLVEQVWQPPTTLLARLRNPYRRYLAPPPPHLVVPTPGRQHFTDDGIASLPWTGEAQHPASGRRSELFDQDALLAAVEDDLATARRARELRGDR